MNSVTCQARAERHTGRPMQFVYTSSYHELSTQLLDGGVQFASLPPVLLVRTERLDGRVKPVALKLISQETAPSAVPWLIQG